MVPLVYISKYNVSACGLERLHPFDSVKFRRIHDWLIRQGLRQASDFTAAQFVATDALRRIHTDAYLQSLRRRQVLARILELGVVARLPAVLTCWRVLRPMRWATGGTLLTCRLAVEHGLAINLGGGFHHAGADRGGGFCVYADAPLALAVRHDELRIASALVIDTDAHQGNGTAK